MSRKNLFLDKSLQVINHSWTKKIWYVSFILTFIISFLSFAEDKQSDSLLESGSTSLSPVVPVGKDPDAIRRAEAARRLEEMRKAEEAKKAEIAKKIEEARKAEEAKKAEAAKRKEEAKKKEIEAVKKREEAKKIISEDKAKKEETKEVEENSSNKTFFKQESSKKETYQEKNIEKEAEKIDIIPESNKKSEELEKESLEEKPVLSLQERKIPEQKKISEIENIDQPKTTRVEEKKSIVTEEETSTKLDLGPLDAQIEEVKASKAEEKKKIASESVAEKPAVKPKRKGTGPVTILFGRPIDAAGRSENQWLGVLIEAILEYKLAAIPDIKMVRPEVIKKELFSHGNLSVTPSDEDYLNVAKRLKTEFVGTQKFELTRDKNVFYYLEISSVEKKVVVSTIELEFKLKKIGQSLDEIIGMILREFDITPPREMARFIKLPAVPENEKLVKDLGDCIVKERYSSGIDSLKLAEDYRKICEKGGSQLLAFCRAGYFFSAIGKDNDAVEAFNLHFMTVPEYTPIYIAYAKAFRKIRRFEDALRITALGEKRGITSSELTVEKAMAYLGMGKQKEAEETYKQILEKDPNDPYALLFYVKFYNDAQKYSDALEYVNRLLKTNTLNGEAYLEQGKSFLALKRYSDAVSALSKASELLPNEIDPVLYLADAYFSTGKYDKALELYEKILQKVNNNIDIYIKAASAAEKLGDSKKAFSILKDIESRFSNHGALQRELGLLALANGDSAKAKVHLEASVRAGTENEKVLVALGWLYLSSKELDKAATMFNKAMEIVKDKNQCKIGLAMVYIQKGETTKAASLLDEISAKNITIPGINMMLGDAMIAKGEKNNALIYYRKERSLGTVDKKLQEKIAELSYQLEPPKSARSEYEQALKMGIVNSTIYYRLVALALNMKDASAADSYLSEAIKLGDADVGTWLAIAKGYSELNMYKQALDAYQKCVQKDPSKEEAWLSIVKLQERQGNDTAVAEANLKLYSINPKKYDKNLADAGRLFEKAGKKEKAKSAYATFIKNQHVDPDINIRLAKMMFDEQNYSAVVSLLQSISATLLGVDNSKILLKSYFATNQYDKSLPIVEYLVSKTPSDPQVYDWAASAYENTKKYDDAIKMYQKYLQLSPKNEKYAYRLAELLEMAGKRDAAIAQYRDNIKLYPRDSRNYTKLAKIYMDAKDWKNAIEMLEKMLTFESASPSIMGQLARAYLALGKKKEAMDYLRSYINNAPEDSMAWYELGKLYYELKEYHNAARALEQAVKLMRKPAFDILKMLGYSLLASADTVKATTYLENARSIDRTNREIVPYLISCYRATKNTRQLTALLSEQIRFEPDNNNLRLELADLYISEGKYSEGTRLLEEIIPKMGCNAELRIKAANIYEKQNDKRRWLEHLQEASKCNPNDPVLLYQIARYYYEQQNRLQAEKYLKAALRADKSYAPANYLGGLLLLERKEYKGAGVLLSRAASVDRSNIDYRIALTEAFYYQGRYEDAYKVIKPVVEKGGTIKPAALRLVGMIYKAMGDAQKAKQILEDALNTDKNCTECLIALGDMYYGEGDHSNAIDKYKKAFELAGFSRDAAMRLAESYLKMDKEDEAKKLYEKVISENQADAEAIYRLVKIYLKKNMISTAKSTLLRGGYNKNGWYFLADAEISEAENNINAALISYGKALKLMPEVPEVQAGCGRISLAKKKFAAAIKYFGMAMAGDPENIDYMLGLAMGYEGNGDRETALELYKEILNKNSSYAEAYYAIARIHAKNKDHQNAIKYLEEAARLNKKDAMIFLALGHEYRAIGNTKVAIENYNKALKIDEIKAVEAYKSMGNIYAKAGDEKKAKKYYEMYIKLGGKDKRVEKYLRE